MLSSSSPRINALLDAVIKGNLSELMDTVTRANVNYTDPQYRLSLLMWAISLGRLPTTEFLLSRGASIHQVDVYGFSALHRAVWCGDVEVVRAVLFISPANRVAGVEYARGDGGGSAPPPRYLPPSCSPMASSTSLGMASLVKLLPPSPQLHQGATAHSSNGVSAITSAYSLQPSVFTGWLVEQDTECAAERRRCAALEAQRKLQWRAGAQRLINMRHTATGRTPLMLAAMRGDAMIVKFLLRVCAADVYATDQDGFTAAELAGLCGHTHVLTTFLAEVPGDGSGRAFPKMQQHGENFRETAKTTKQRMRLDEINALLCLDISPQSRVSAK